jgi:hypothetical protein
LDWRYWQNILKLKYFSIALLLSGLHGAYHPAKSSYWTHKHNRVKIEVLIYNVFREAHHCMHVQNNDQQVLFNCRRWKYYENELDEYWDGL